MHVLPRLRREYPGQRLPELRRWFLLAAHSTKARLEKRRLSRHVSGQHRGPASPGASSAAQEIRPIDPNNSPGDAMTAIQPENRSWEACPPRAWLDAPRVQLLWPARGLEPIARFGALKVFREGVKTASEAGALPFSTSVFGFTTQCPYCIELHSDNACNAGATDASWSRPRWSPPPCGQERPSPTRRTRCQIERSRLID